MERARTWNPFNYLGGLQEQGLRLLGLGVDRLRDQYFDLKFGISTRRRRSSQELGIEFADSIHYQPISYADFGALLALLPKRTSADVFIDFGCGKGRALCLAGKYPFKRIIGIEIAAELCESARRNVTRLLPKLKCRDITVINANATDYDIPIDANVLYFFNPFTGLMLRSVLERIAQSLQTAPRKISILFCGSVTGKSFPAQANACPWLNLTQQVTLPTGRLGCRYENVVWAGGAEEPSGPSNSDDS